MMSVPFSGAIHAGSNEASNHAGYAIHAGSNEASTQNTCQPGIWTSTAWLVGQSCGLVEAIFLWWLQHCFQLHRPTLNPIKLVEVSPF